MNGAKSSVANPEHSAGCLPYGLALPSDDEWKELEMYLGMTEIEVHKTDWRGTREGLMLRESGDSHWFRLRWYVPGTNESGFTALPGGSRWYDESFRYIEQRANFWSATESISSYAWCRRLYHSKTGVYRYDDYKSRAYSVRCVKD